MPTLECNNLKTQNLKFQRYYITHLINAFILFASNWILIKESYLCEDGKVFFVKIIYIFSSFFIIPLLLSLISRLFIFFASINLIISSTLSYFQFHYGIIISTTLMQSTLHTDINEVAELINMSLLTWLTLFGILPIVIIYYLNVKNYPIPKISWDIILISGIFSILGAIISILPSNVYTPKFLADSFTSYMPYNYLISLKNYYSVYYNNSLPKQDINKVFDFKLNKSYPDNINIILVIGESSRSDRWSLNGYKRNTSPNLSSLINIISYKKTYSLATNTPGGVQNIMSESNHHEFSSFISIFNSLGFNTYWLSNQGTKYKVINSIAKEAKSHIFSDDIRINSLGNNYDEALLPFLENILQKKGRNLIVLHSIGSHRLYDLRYPDKFKIFQPTCLNGELYYSVNECRDSVKLNNSYDNTILYTDYFLSEIIKRVQNHKALFIYISDHGESLGENGIYAHAYPLDKAPIQQIHIPLFIWASQRFLDNSLNFQKFNNAKNKVNNIIDQSYIFHTILDCSGINSPGINLNLSLCSNK